MLRPHKYFKGASYWFVITLSIFGLLGLAILLGRSSSQASLPAPAKETASDHVNEQRSEGKVIGRLPEPQFVPGEVLVKFNSPTGASKLLQASKTSKGHAQFTTSTTGTKLFERFGVSEVTQPFAFAKDSAVNSVGNGPPRNSATATPAATLLAQFSQQGPKLVGTGAVGNANQGFSVALYADGNTAIVGGYNDNSGAGAAWVFTVPATSCYTYTNGLGFGTDVNGNVWNIWSANGSNIWDWHQNYVGGYLHYAFKIYNYTGYYCSGSCRYHNVWNKNPNLGFEISNVLGHDNGIFPESAQNNHKYQVDIQWNATGYHASVYDITSGSQYSDHDYTYPVNTNTYDSWTWGYSLWSDGIAYNDEDASTHASQWTATVPFGEPTGTTGGGGDVRTDALPVVLPTQQKPLIFIPGLMGSSLDDSPARTNVWLGILAGLLTDHYVLTLDPNKTQLTIVPVDAIRSVSIPIPFHSPYKLYESLLNFLKTTGGYREYNVNGDPQRRTTSGCDLSQSSNNPNLFVFAYDWRLSNAENVAKLKDYVGCVQRFYSGTKVDILTHSMGGLLARRYILVNPTDHAVNKLITIAAPWLGAPKAIGVMETGEYDADLNKIIFKSTLKSLSEFFPSAHQLLPSPTYFTLGGHPFVKDGNVFNDYDQFAEVFNGEFRSIPATTGRAFHDRAGQDDWRIDQSGVQYYHIYGKKLLPDTIGTVHSKVVTTCSRLRGQVVCKTQRNFDKTYTRGDGTVPILSAERRSIGLGLNFNAPNATLKLFASPDPAPAVNDLFEHTGLTKNPDVQNYILSILNSTQQGQVSAAETVEPTVLPAYYLRETGAATVTVSDTAGNTTNPLSDLSDDGIPSVTTQIMGEKSALVVMPTDQTYIITMRSDADPITLEITKGTDTETTQAIRYQDLVLPVGVTAIIKITAQGVELLKYDSDGDGTFETTVTPTVSVSGSAAQDADPPTVSIIEARQQTGTLVTIAATDSGSGVKAVYYSLDGTQYQPYTQPFTVDPYRTPTVYAFADDNVANRSGLVTFKLTAPASNIQSSQSSYSVGKGDGHAMITVTRTGDTTGQASINYATSDTAGLTPCGQPNTGIASSRCNYATTVGTLRFAVGESTKTIFIPIVDSAYAEGNKSFTLILSNLTGATLGMPSVATITIINNNAVTAGNPVVNSSFFVRQQYIDFLGREPDPGGLAGWLDVLNNCGTKYPTPCDRIEVSAGFFRSPEFQDRGYFVFRFYPAALGRNPNYAEFMPDLAKVSGFLSDAQLEANKVAFVSEFMNRPEFQNKYGSLTDAGFRTALVQTAGIDPGISFPNGTMTRAQFLRAFVEHSAVYQKFYNQSFVVMQYFGYLRRDPDILYLQWIQTMNQNGGDYRTMINGFMNSSEYFLRFGP